MAMTPKEIIAVLQHFEAGGEVQYRSTFDKDFILWRDSINPAWNFGDFEYRPKPKPLELWVNVGTGSCFAHRTKETAILHAADGVRTVHMREVVE